MNNELPETKIDEKTRIEYHLEGDYYIPNLVMPEQEKITLNKYGRMRLKYLKENKKVIKSGRYTVGNKWWFYNGKFYYNNDVIGSFSYNK